MAKVSDQELKKAFSELQEMMVDATQKLKLADVQIETLKRTKQRGELTIKEITLLPSETRTYESVGRMFLLDDISSIKSGLEQRIKASDEKIKSLEYSKTFLRRNLKDSENHLREMVQQRQSKETSN
ncbi:prefoldin subunit 1 [Cephus cinctus]|uniref:Prefoldin subunit 1 n=1 Tax=Cephus cinctus TaxID=211228 RepID=A0AAJ7BNS6_CEPCN|nr:prefoldin subunit 1 [Cephus cinctus]